MLHLPNHLRAHRKRLGLSQDDVAFLLGVESGAKVCRYERFARVPSLEAALAYVAIFQRPLRELFSGHYQRIEKEVAKRARDLIKKTHQQKPSRRKGQKGKALTDIASRPGKAPPKKE